MKRLYPAILLLVAGAYLTLTGFQCGSAETTSAKLYMQQKNWAKAEESLLKEIAKNEKNEEAQFLLGQVRFELKKYMEMNDSFTKALALGETHKPDIVRYRMSVWGSLFNEGVAQYNKGREDPAAYDKAIEMFNTAIAMVPDSANTYYVAALAYYAKKDLPASIATLESAIQRDPNYTDAYRLLGQLYRSQGAAKQEAKDEAGGMALYQKALGAFEKVYQFAPTDVDNIGNLIDMYERMKQSDKALKLTSEAVAKDPTNKVFRYAYGAFLLKQEEYPKAAEQFEAALKIDPNYTDASYNLGVTYLNWGVMMREEAEKRYEAERKANKGKDVKEDFTYKEKYKAALPYLEAAIASREDEPILWQTLGKVYASLNMTDKAKAAFEKFDKLTKGAK
jgi:tetratricopeptide (TPR) repeat protein